MRVSGRLLSIATCTVILLLAEAIPHTRITQADIPTIPIGVYETLQRDFSALKVTHEKTIGELGEVKRLLLHTKWELDMEHRRKWLVEALEAKGHKICMQHQYYLYDVMAALVVKHFERDPEVMKILKSEDLRDPFAVVLSLIDLESSSHSAHVGKAYKGRDGRTYHDIGLCQIQIPLWTADQQEIKWFLDLGVIKEKRTPKGKLLWDFLAAVENLKDPWKNAEVFARCFIPELKRYRDMKLALIRYNGWRPKNTDWPTFMDHLKKGDLGWLNKHLNDVYYREVAERYAFYVNRMNFKI